MDMIQYGSIVPERENLPYFLIAMPWFTRWQKYTGCLKVDAGDDDNVSISQVKLNIRLGEYPGEINSRSEVGQLMRDTSKILTARDDYYGECYLKDGKKEDQDYKVVD